MFLQKWLKFDGFFQKIALFCFTKKRISPFFLIQWYIFPFPDNISVNQKTLKVITKAKIQETCFVFISSLFLVIWRLKRCLRFAYCATFTRWDYWIRTVWCWAFCSCAFDFFILKHIKKIPLILTQAKAV